MVFVAIVNLIEQMLVFKAQHLILKESHVGSLIFDFLKTLFLLDVVAHQMVVFTLLFFQMVVDLENFDFSVKILSYAVVEASKINKSIPFYNWAFWVSKCRVIFIILRFVDQGSSWQILVRLNRNGLFRETTGEYAIRKIACWGLYITIQIEDRDARFIIGSLFLSSQTDAETLMQTGFTNFSRLLLALLILYFHFNMFNFSRNKTFQVSPK
jgi:hypothetical protein